MSIDLKELSNVIMSCRRARVSKLTLGDLVIEFEPREGARTKKKVAGEAVPEMTPELQAELTQVTDYSRLKETIETKEDQLALLQLEDPTGYEEALAERELEGEATNH